MNAEGDSGTSGGFASPPCFMHELDPACSTGDDYDAQTAIDVARWRISQRKQLIQARMAVPAVRRGLQQTGLPPVSTTKSVTCGTAASPSSGLSRLNLI